VSGGVRRSLVRGLLFTFTTVARHREWLRSSRSCAREASMDRRSMLPGHGVGCRLHGPAVHGVVGRLRGAGPERGGEGCHYANDTVWFTTRGDNRVWQLNLTTGTYELAYDDNLVKPGPAPLTGVDNITGSSFGDLYVAEDGGNMEICLIKPDDRISVFLRITGQSGSEILRAGVHARRRPVLLLVVARHVRLIVGRDHLLRHRTVPHLAADALGRRAPSAPGRRPDARRTPARRRFTSSCSSCPCPSCRSSCSSSP
jgi:hypothetical protein